MDKETQYTKYKTRGSDYHYKQIKKKNLKLFNAYIYAKFQIEIELLLKIIKNLNQKNRFIRILDIGCGDGAIFYLIKKRCDNYNLELFGIDNSEIALETARKNVSNGNFRYADVYNLPFNKNFFDIIISTDVIEHISEPNKMLKEIKRVGKNNSYIIIGTPIKYTENPIDKTHYYEFFPVEFHNFLRSFFENVNIIQSHRLFYLLLYNKIFSLFRRRREYFRYIINIISIFLNKNPFLKIKNKDHEVYSYIFGIGKIVK